MKNTSCIPWSSVIMCTDFSIFRLEIYIVICLYGRIFSLLIINDINVISLSF